jgi:hypothetical protein
MTIGSPALCPTCIDASLQVERGVSVTNKERVIEYLRSIAPKSATTPTSVPERASRHMPRSSRSAELTETNSAPQPSGPAPAESPPVADQEASETPAGFERAACLAISRDFNTALSPARLHGVPKTFDFVSEDRRIVGDAKYCTLVNGAGTPPRNSPSSLSMSGCWKRPRPTYAF